MLDQRPLLEGFPVIGGDDDQRVVEKAEVLRPRKQPGDFEVLVSYASVVLGTQVQALLLGDGPLQGINLVAKNLKVLQREVLLPSGEEGIERGGRVLRRASVHVIQKEEEPAAVPFYPVQRSEWIVPYTAQVEASRSAP